MATVRFSVVFVLWLLGTAPALAQSQVWIQIEAKPSLAEAEDQAWLYAGRLEDVSGFQLAGSSWYAVALGPYDRATAERELRRLRLAGRIPSDSYLAERADFGDRFFGDDPAVPRRPAPAAVESESAAGARRMERRLSAAEREEVQAALRDAGFYDGPIDAAFGQGTRAAMADWQAANGHSATGVLTAAQRTGLLAAHRSALDGLGIMPVADRRAGVEVAMPTALVELSRYAAPFALYDTSGEVQARVLLISQPGDRGTLRGLYDVIQTLDFVPAEGERAFRDRAFTIEGRNDEIVSSTYAEVADGAVKGFTLVWPAGDEIRRTRLLRDMQASFRRLPGVLDPPAAQREEPAPDLVAGLAPRRPERGRSGFFVAADGAVLTTDEAVAGCRRVTLNDAFDAEIEATDPDAGLALLRPSASLTPPRHARFRARPPQRGDEIAVAGYPFGGALPVPTLTFGEVAASGAAADDPWRLALGSAHDDAGGPVIDAEGGVLGLLLPSGSLGRATDASARAASSAVIATFLSNAGVSPAASEPGAVLAPEDLTRLATEMTVLVACWS